MAALIAGESTAIPSPLAPWSRTLKVAAERTEAERRRRKEDLRKRMGNKNHAAIHASVILSLAKDPRAFAHSLGSFARLRMTATEIEWDRFRALASPRRLFPNQPARVW